GMSRTVSAPARTAREQRTRLAITSARAADTSASTTGGGAEREASLECPRAPRLVGGLPPDRPDAAAAAALEAPRDADGAGIVGAAQLVAHQRRGARAGGELAHLLEPGIASRRGKPRDLVREAMRVLEGHRDEPGIPGRTLVGPLTLPGALDTSLHGRPWRAGGHDDDPSASLRLLALGAPGKEHLGQVPAGLHALAPEHLR